jgi:glycosidase
MKQFCLLFFVGLLTIACSKKTTIVDTPPPPPVVVDTDPVQYGVPYTAVPDRQDATIYQVNMRSFSAAGNFAGVLARLDSIKALGVNVIYLMPIYPVGTVNAVNSPYCVKDYKAVNSEFGNLADLRMLVDAAHAKNMAVLFDWIANHTAWDNAWITAHKDWYLQNAGGTILSPPGTGWNDVAQLNFNNAAMRLEMIKCMKYWVYTANIDGYRFDYADGPPVDFWKQAVDTLRNITTHKLLLMAEGNRTANYTAGFDYNFGFSFYGQLKSVFNNNQPATNIDNLNASEYVNATGTQLVVRYTTNHDVNSSDGTPLDLFGGINGSLAAFVVAAYMKSVPMVYNGQEVGLPYRLTFPFTSTKINWTNNYQIASEYKKILALRASSVALRRGTLTSYSNANVCAFTKEATGEKVVVLANLRNSTTNYTLPNALANTTWTNAMTNTTINFTTQVSLPAYSYIIAKQ